MRRSRLDPDGGVTATAATNGYREPGCARDSDARASIAGAHGDSSPLAHANADSGANEPHGNHRRCAVRARVGY